MDSLTIRRATTNSLYRPFAPPRENGAVPLHKQAAVSQRLSWVNHMHVESVMSTPFAGRMTLRVDEGTMDPKLLLPSLLLLSLVAHSSDQSSPTLIVISTQTNLDKRGDKASPLGNSSSHTSLNFSAVR